MPPKLKFISCLMAFLMGLTGRLFINVPGAGILPMLDVVSYVIAIPLLCLTWGKMGYYARKTVLWGIVWALAAVVANTLTFYDSWYFWKSVMVVSSGWVLMVVAWWVLNRDARLFLLYLMGTGLGAAISIHYFQNGAVMVYARSATGLIEKQIYPKYALAIVLSGLLPICLLVKKRISMLIIVFIIIIGVYLLYNGGSRSGFGIFAFAGGVGFLAVYGKHFIRSVCKSVFLCSIIFLFGFAIVFGIYSHLAKTGALGELQAKKYEDEEGVKIDTGHGRMSSRAGLQDTWEVFKEKPWGEGGTNRRHSVISNSWNCEGLVGLLFWVYFFWVVLWFIRKRLFYSGILAAFIGLQIFTAMWDAIGSPFNTRNIFFSLMIYIALCRDNQLYGRDTIFEDFPKYLK